MKNQHYPYRSKPTESYQYHDLYVIGDKQRPDRIKIGISSNVKGRLRNIQTASGISDDDFSVLRIEPRSGKYEALLKHIFSGQQITGEWYYRNGIVSVFLDALANDIWIDEELMCYLLIIKKHNENSDIEAGYDHLKRLFESRLNSARNVYNMIISERKGLGFPNSTPFLIFLRNYKMAYRNFSYFLIVEEHSYSYRRKPHFKLESATDRQLIEILRLSKNNSRSLSKRIIIQEQIDIIFEGDKNILDYSLIKECWEHLSEGIF